MKRLPYNIVAIICNELKEEVPVIEQCNICSKSYILLLFICHNIYL